MVFPIFLLLATAFLILSICRYVYYRGKGMVKRSDWKGRIIATPIITAVVLGIGSLAVSGQSLNVSSLDYADNVREAGVERFIPIETNDTTKYMFILDNGEAIAVKDYNLDILESSDGPGKVRYGYAYESWGHWLPFNDWLTDDYHVEYTPGK